MVLGYFKTSPSTIEPLKGRDTAILDEIVSIQKKLTDLLLMRVVYHSKPISTYIVEQCSKNIFKIPENLRHNKMIKNAFIQHKY